MKLMPKAKAAAVRRMTERAQGVAAFSLTELLIVMAIIVVLAGLMAPALNSALRGTQLTQATDKVIGVLSIARQTAVTKSQTVEVRFYAYIDPESPGDNGQGHALQAFSIDDSGNALPIMKVQTLPPRIVMTTNGTYSTLLTQTNSPLTQIGIPKAGTNYTCSSFRYYRGGVTSLAASPSSSQVWGVTLVNQSETVGSKASSLPANYTTVVIDPFNGSVRTYRPSL